MTAGRSTPGLLRVRGLEVRFPGAAEPAVSGVDLDLAPGRCVALVGESGSGKSVTARSLLGLAGPGARVRADELSLDGEDLRSAPERAWAGLRGRRIGLAVQDALVSLDPLRPVGREIGDSPRLHERLPRAARRRRAEDLLASLGVDRPAERARQRAPQLSGGQRQRALIAAALSADPGLLVADEPTSSLDALVQAEVLGVLRAVVARGHGLLLISHDLDLVAGIADSVLVLRAGRVVEHGPAAEVLERPRRAYTRALLAAAPTLEPRRDPGPAHAAGAPPLPAASPLLSASALTVSFRRPGGQRLLALDDVSLVLRRGETLGVMGASGSGKSTLLRALLGVQRLDFGIVGLRGGPWSALSERGRRPSRRLLGFVPQDALGTMDPRWSVGRTIADALPPGTRPSARAGRVAELLDRVGLDGALASRSPVALSGGQRQRVAIARALAGEPEVLLCDEPVSSLDVTVQAAVLDTLERLQRETGLGMVFVSHDLGVLARVSDRIAVMTEGRIVEEGSAAAILGAPAHAYTARLVAAYRRARVKSGGSPTRAHP